MRKRDRQAVLAILLDHDCEEPDVALRKIAAVVDQAIERRVGPLKSDLAHLRSEIHYLVDQDASGIGIEREATER